MLDNESYPILEYDKDYCAVNNEANINACFEYYGKNHYGLMDFREARFIVSLRQFFRRTGFLSPKQFRCLNAGIHRHQLTEIEATAFHEDCGHR